MTAQRRKRRKKKNSSNIRKTRLFITFVTILIFFGGIYLLSSRNLVDNPKHIILVHGNDDINVLVFDTSVDEITNIVIPQSTEVNVAESFGTFRIGSVWELSLAESSGGELLAKTVTKNFKFPIYLWAEEGALGLANSNYLNLIKSVFSKYRTNLTFGDRLRISAFSLGVPNSRRKEIILSQTPYLKRITLIDGEEGFKIEKEIPVKILSIFASPTITRGEYRVSVRTDSESSNAANDVAEIIEVLGAKVSSITYQEGDVEGCEVSGVDESSVYLISKIFSCSVGELRNDATFDLEVVLGEEFEESF